MKKFLTPLIFLISGILLIVGMGYPDSLSAVYRGAHSILGTPSAVVQIGEVASNTTFQRRIPLFNFHTEPVVINSVGASCGCTEASVEPMTIKPLAFAYMTVSVSPSSSGKATQIVTVNTNLGQQDIPVTYISRQK